MQSRSLHHKTSKSSPAGHLSFGAVIFLLALSMTIVPNGAVASPHAQTSAIFLTLVLGPVLLSTKFERPTSRAIWLVLFFVCLMTAGVGLQIAPMPMDRLSHPVWIALSETFPISHGYLSVNPSRSLEALPALILPFLTAVAVLGMSQNRHVAKSLWYGLTGVGLAILALSVALEAFLSNSHQGMSGSNQSGSFAGVFVNRNAAAAFFVLTAFATLGTLAFVQKKDQWRVGAVLRSRRALQYGVFTRGLLLLCFLACVTAIIATTSRAGAMISLPLLFLCLAILFGRKMTYAPRLGRKVLHFVLIIVVMLILLFGTFAFIGDSVLARAETEDDGSRMCVYQGTLAAIRHHWAFGSGLGTFRDVFPAYRPIDCGGANVTWHRAHNSFLEFTLNTGIAGPIFILGLVGLIVVGAITGLRRGRGVAFMPIIVLLLSAYLLMHSMVDFPLQIPGIANYAAALLACAISLAQPQRRYFTGSRHSDNVNSGRETLSYPEASAR